MNAASKFLLFLILPTVVLIALFPAMRALTLVSG